MSTHVKAFAVFSVLIVAGLLCVGCRDSGADGDGGVTAAGSADIILLHHSTGWNVWNGGVPEWFVANAPAYRIVEQEFPKDSPYGWENYPYDYWNIWVNHAGSAPYLSEPTLEILTAQYRVIVWKHCFPVGDIEADTGNPEVASAEKRLENYRLQYEALKAKMHEFPGNRFIVWTGAALTQNSTYPEAAARARTFFEWVKNTWDERGDNIYVWDFYELETEGGLYLREDYAESADDSHPNGAFSQMVALLLGQRIVNVIEGRGDSTSPTGR